MRGDDVLELFGVGIHEFVGGYSAGNVVGVGADTDIDSHRLICQKCDEGVLEGLLVGGMSKVPPVSSDELVAAQSDQITDS